MLWYLEEFVSISEMPGGVGWDGMGRGEMSWDGSGVGARYAMWKKLEKETVFYQQISPRHDCGVLLASEGQLMAPLGLMFALLFITWGVLVPSWAKAPTKYEI